MTVSRARGKLEAAIARFGLAARLRGANDPRDKVRRDPRSGGIPLCADCFGRTSPNVLRRMAD